MAGTPLKPLAGIGVTDARHEEGQGKGQHENVQHGMFLCDVNCEPAMSRFQELRCATGRIGFRDWMDGDVIGIS
jgi:hypothetical protein